MTSWYAIALTAGAAIAVVYLALVVRGFLKVRRELLAPARPAAEPVDGEAYESQGVGFMWKTIAGAAASLGLLALAGLGGAFWYLLPVLAFGTALAVIVAFLIDGDRDDESP